ncbi:MAG: MFS transporter [Sphingomonas sp. 66-10]|uniref:MFS transporter n=1 Tax=Sphingomonas sp. 66-10 TaxID=1895848 RepID=UPI0009286E09|nr:MFS transporter [Sphingomonas sp. 66-10]OJU23304.1 MAG: MFS transporter [Sphingomonas sp. 66-10]
MSQPRIASKFKGLTRDSWLLALASLFTDISTEMLYPVLPIYLTQTLGATGLVVGVIEGVATGAQNLIQGVSGSLSDRLQRRKPIALAGYAVAALAKPLIGASSAWQGVLGARFLDRLGTGVRSAPRDALIAASADRASRGRAFGLEGVGDNLGAFLGPLITVGLLLLLHIELRMIFFLAIFPGLLAFATVMLVRERAAEVQAKAKIEVSLSHLPGPYRRYLVATLVFGIGNSSNAFLILKTRELGASLVTTVLIYAGFNLVAALVSYPAGAIADRVGRRELLIGAYAIFFLTYLGFAFTPGLGWAAALFVLYGAFQGIFRAVGKALVSDLVPDHLRASGIGWYSAAIGLSGLIAGLVGGLLWDRLGHASVFLYGAAFAALGGVAFVALVPAGTGARS